jgi:hypothetical protein
MGAPISNVNKMKSRKKAPPPFSPVIYGSFQMAPNPIADPAAARINPSFEVH